VPTDGAGELALPIRVAVADLERLPEEISARRTGGRDYAGLWLLVRSGGTPRRLLKLRFEDGRVTRAALEREIGAAGGSAALPPLPEPVVPVTVVVCTMIGREEELRACLESLAALDYPQYEVLLVDNRPPGAPRHPAWLDRAAHVRVLREPRPGASAARNLGLAEATGEIVAFTDDDVVVDPGWLAAFARRFAAHPEEVCATGLVLPNDLETEAQAGLERFYGGFGQRRLDPVSHRLAAGGGALAAPVMLAVGDDGAVTSTFLLLDFGKFGAGASMAFRAQALRAVGGFDLRLGPGTPTYAGEELCVFARLAWRRHAIAFVPSALVFHSHRRELESLRRQVHCYGVGYTAAILALSLSEPRLALATALTLPRGVLVLARAQLGKLRRSRGAGAGAGAATVGAGLARVELLGMAQGPAALLRSALRVRRGGGHG
jgi:Glycosyl transferase family 2